VGRLGLCGVPGGGKHVVPGRDEVKGSEIVGDGPAAGAGFPAGIAVGVGVGARVGGTGWAGCWAGAAWRWCTWPVTSGWTGWWR
jgi:hypothetical protein